jgi:hypothetical protein
MSFCNGSEPSTMDYGVLSKPQSTGVTNKKGYFSVIESLYRALKNKVSKNLAKIECG